MVHLLVDIPIKIKVTIKSNTVQHLLGAWRVYGEPRSLDLVQLRLLVSDSNRTRRPRRPGSRGRPRASHGRPDFQATARSLPLPEGFPALCSVKQRQLRLHEVLARAGNAHRVLRGLRSFLLRVGRMEFFGSGHEHV